MARGDKVDKIITDKFIERIEASLKAGKDFGKWTRPWTLLGHAGKLCMNLISKRPYSGSNLFILAMSGHKSPYWMTAKQIKANGGLWKSTEDRDNPSLITFQKPREKEDSAGNKKIVGWIGPIFYKVWNADQVFGLGIEVPDHSKEEKPKGWDPIGRAEKIVTDYFALSTAPRLTNGGDQAGYSPALDKVIMPTREQFLQPEMFYKVLFHEMAHSTGHESRLKRSGIMDPISFGSHQYSKEELIAEMGAAFMSVEAGIDAITEDNSVKYLENWIISFKNDVTLLRTAGTAAQKARNFILNLNEKEEEGGGEQEAVAA